MVLASHCSGISSVQSFYFHPSLDVTPLVHPTLPVCISHSLPSLPSLYQEFTYETWNNSFSCLIFPSSLGSQSLHRNMWHFLWEPVAAVLLCFCQTYGICHFEEFQERKASPYSEPSGNTTFINDYNKSVSALPLCFYLQTSQRDFLWEANSQLTYSRRQSPRMLSKASQIPSHPMILARAQAFK